MAPNLFLLSVLLCTVTNSVCADAVDLSKCKVTMRGTEYMGYLSQTESKATCQYWTVALRNLVPGKQNDSLFPEGHVRKARNYCRNPGGVQERPWCFTTRADLLTDFCNVPYCQVSECRFTGPGMEYNGSLDKTASGRACLKWNKPHFIAEGVKAVEFSNWMFADGSRSKAASYCRNPDEDPSGPWCYVKKQVHRYVQKELCDIPLCDDTGSLRFSDTSNSSDYSHFTRINATGSVNLSLKLWHPQDWNNSRVFLFLSAIDTDCNRRDIKIWGSGVEIALGYPKAEVTTEEESFGEATPMFLTGVNWTTVVITWETKKNETLFINVYHVASSRSIALAEIQLHDKLLKNNEIQYFSISGSRVLWNISNHLEQCPIETTSQETLTRYWPLQFNESEREVWFSIKGNHAAVLEFRKSPGDGRTDTKMWVTLNRKNFTEVEVATANGERTSLSQVHTPGIMNLWAWRDLKISITGQQLKVYKVEEKRKELILEVSQERFQDLMWVGISSKFVTYWALFCNPRIGSHEPHATDCVTSTKAEDYNGTLSVSETGRHCVPWIDSNLIPSEYHDTNLFDRFGGKLKSKNYCRNLDKGPQGPFCFVRLTNISHRQYCRPQSCFDGECRTAGTANDYLGKQYMTRSGRVCKFWKDLTNFTQLHNFIYQPENFPDPGPEEAQNFCRNPTRSIGGPWCFTEDKEVTSDYCSVRDCDRNLDCTVLLSKITSSKTFYILPVWKEYGLNFWLKNWNPEKHVSFIVDVFSLNKTYKYRLTIRESNVTLSITTPNIIENVVLHKTIEHSIPSGKWAGFRLITKKEYLGLGHTRLKTYFFEWTPEKENEFEPVFINYGSDGGWIGFALSCSECLIEESHSRLSHDRYYPWKLWDGYGNESLNELTLFIRTSGSFLISLHHTPDKKKFIGLMIRTKENDISVVKPSKKVNNLEYKKTVLLKSEISDKNWTEIKLSTFKRTLTVLNVKSNVELLQWRSNKTLLFYWFSISAYHGTVSWAANCHPQDINWPPRDGGWSSWSPWTCSASCDGGVGFTYRTCDNPAPNVFGQLCQGSNEYHGLCNDFPCGEISPGTHHFIRNELSRRHQSLIVEEGNPINISCNLAVVKKVLHEAEVEISWLVNGLAVNNSKTVISPEFQLGIRQTSADDSGVYMCVAQQQSKYQQKVILDIATLAVTSTEPTAHVRATKSLPLTCNGVALSYAYADLSQKWVYNGIVWKDYGITTLEAVAQDKAERISLSDAGIWVCVIEQQDFGFQWTTNWILLEVLPPPSIWSHLMEDSATAPLFKYLPNESYVMVVVLGTIFSVVGAIIVLTAILARFVGKTYAVARNKYRPYMFSFNSDKLRYALIWILRYSIRVGVVGR